MQRAIIETNVRLSVSKSKCLDNMQIIVLHFSTQSALIVTKIVQILSALFPISTLCANCKTKFLDNAARYHCNQSVIISEHVKMLELYKDHFSTFSNTKRAEISD